MSEPPDPFQVTEEFIDSINACGISSFFVVTKNMENHYAVTFKSHNDAQCVLSLPSQFACSHFYKELSDEQGSRHLCVDLIVKLFHDYYFDVDVVEETKKLSMELQSNEDHKDNNNDNDIDIDNEDKDDRLLYTELSSAPWFYLNGSKYELHRKLGSKQLMAKCVDGASCVYIASMASNAVFITNVAIKVGACDIEIFDTFSKLVTKFALDFDED